MFQKSKRRRLRYHFVNKPLSKRLNWEQIESKPRQEGRKVVKGTSKRVVVVKSPDPKLFEQAIFILKEDLCGGHAGAGSDVLRQAERVADDYVKNYVSGEKKLLARIPPAAFAAIGALATAGAWLMIYLL